MIKKIEIIELEAGMYVCGVEKKGQDEPMFFSNTVLIRDSKDLRRFADPGLYNALYIDTLDEAEVPVPVKKPVPQNDCQGPEQAGAAVLGTEVKENNSSETPSEQLVCVPDDTKKDEPEKDAPPQEAESPKPVETGPDASVNQSFFGEEAGHQEKNSIEDRAQFQEELKLAKEIKKEAAGLVKDFMHSVAAGKKVDTEKVHSTVEKMVESIFRNQDALTSLARLKSFDDYTFVHSVNVCVLAISLGKSLGFSKSELHDLGAGAILHDIGKMLVPEGILRKPGSLTDPELVKMRNHVDYGAEIVAGSKDLKDQSKAVVHEHHERVNGQGYPLKKTGTDIHFYAKIASIVDTYDAMTSDRPYQKGMLPDDALRRIYKMMRDGHFEAELVERLIKCLGIYPIGSLVLLNTGEVALVRALNRTNPLQPVVLMVMDKSRKPYLLPFEVDLSETSRSVVSCKDPRETGIITDLNTLL